MGWPDSYAGTTTTTFEVLVTWLGGLVFVVRADLPDAWKERFRTKLPRKAEVSINFSAMNLCRIGSPVSAVHQ